MPRGYETVSTLNKGQKALFDRYIQGAQQGPSGYFDNPLYQSGANYLQGILSGNPESFAAFEAPAMRQFHQQIIPQIAERFGGIGGLSSSAFQQALGGASVDLSERLAQLRGQLQQGAAGQALQYAGAPLQQGNQLLNMETQAFLKKQPAWWQSALTGLVGGAASAFGGGFGTTIGTGLANKLLG